VDEYPMIWMESIRKNRFSRGRNQLSIGLRKGIETQPFSEDHKKEELVIKSLGF
jgi:hypothetical protein